MATEAKSRVSSAAGNGKQGHSLISDAKFRQLYGLTLRLQPGAGGREAVLAAVGADLRPGDAVVAEPAVMKALGAAVQGISSREGGEQFRERAIAALGAAAADRMRGKGRLTVLFVPGHGAEPMPREAHAMASAARLPVLFVEEAVSGRNARDGKSAQEPDENQLPTIPVDAQDVVALYRVAHESIARARSGSGPTRIVCTAWPSRNAAAETAVEHLEHWLESRGLPAQDWRRGIEAELRSTTRTASESFA